jgi:hypothetical protein
VNDYERKTDISGVRRRPALLSMYWRMMLGVVRSRLLETFEGV